MMEEQPITIVMYHAVSPDGGPYCVTPPTFLRQIEAIAAHCPVIPFASLPEALSAGQEERRVVLTFDDAFLDYLQHAYPLLERLQLPSALFVPTGFIGGYNRWDRGTPDWRRRALLSRAQLRELHAGGLVHIGSHTVDHVRMSQVPPEQMRHQAQASRAALEEILGAPVTSFAYPYGQLADFSAVSGEILAESGYRLAATTHWGTRNSTRELLRLKRISFAETDDATSVRRKIAGWYDWLGWKERAGHLARRLTGRRSQARGVLQTVP